MSFVKSDVLKVVVQYYHIYIIVMYKPFNKALPKRKPDGCENRHQSSKPRGCRWRLDVVEIVDMTTIIVKRSASKQAIHAPLPNPTPQSRSYNHVCALCWTTIGITLYGQSISALLPNWTVYILLSVKNWILSASNALVVKEFVFPLYLGTLLQTWKRWRVCGKEKVQAVFWSRCEIGYQMICSW